jgi:hypothetical protein
LNYYCHHPVVAEAVVPVVPVAVDLLVAEAEAEEGAVAEEGAGA